MASKWSVKLTHSFAQNNAAYIYPRVNCRLLIAADKDRDPIEMLEEPTLIRAFTCRLSTRMASVTIFFTLDNTVSRTVTTQLNIDLSRQSPISWFHDPEPNWSCVHGIALLFATLKLWNVISQVQSWVKKSLKHPYATFHLNLIRQNHYNDIIQWCWIKIQQENVSVLLVYIKLYEVPVSVMTANSATGQFGHLLFIAPVKQTKGHQSSKKE